MVKLGELVMILDLHRQGLTVSAIARELGVDRKTVRRCIARGLEPPVYGPRKPRKRLIDPFVSYLRERVTAYPGLTGRRLWRELGERGYQGGYTAVTDVLRDRLLHHPSSSRSRAQATASGSMPISCRSTSAPKPSSTRQSHHNRRAAAVGHQSMEQPITQPADHRNPPAGEFYFGTSGEN